MQMKGGETTTPGNKSPPPPMVQQSVGDVSVGHSRNVSQGSSKSQAAKQTGPVVVPKPEPMPEDTTSVAVVAHDTKEEAVAAVQVEEPSLGVATEPVATAADAAVEPQAP